MLIKVHHAVLLKRPAWIFAATVRSVSTWEFLCLGRGCGRAGRGLRCRWTADALLCGSPTRSARRSAGKHGDKVLETDTRKTRGKNNTGCDRR